jgi:hypothetical protein
MRSHLQYTLSLLVATLREIFDEAAYARFLARQGMIRSRESYALFEKVMRSQAERKIRCC